MGKAGQTYSLRVKQKKKSKRVSIVHTHTHRQADRQRKSAKQKSIVWISMWNFQSNWTSSKRRDTLLICQEEWITEFANDEMKWNASNTQFNFSLYYVLSIQCTNWWLNIGARTIVCERVCEWKSMCSTDWMRERGRGRAIDRKKDPAYGPMIKIRSLILILF